ncbi:nucleoside 2-deoxyribosyltransferase domain-containing protein [Candidatus Woesearchaeota archaeon]|nr:nucleoside 2-deoxyribosyltransferase domain-containing protein [Candidatus Woesearchaeota archaeon]
MEYVEALNDYQGNKKSLFLAGGITNCPDWQSELVSMLQGQDIAVYNPRRKNFPIHDPSAAEKQIRWEHDKLRKADAISFWFPKETLCPIVLYELGKWTMSDKPLFIGIDPAYQRRQDVEIQTMLERPDAKLVYDLQSLAGQIKGWAKQ